MDQRKKRAAEQAAAHALARQQKREKQRAMALTVPHDEGMRR